MDARRAGHPGTRAGRGTQGRAQGAAPRDARRAGHPERAQGGAPRDARDAAPRDARDAAPRAARRTRHPGTRAGRGAQAHRLL